jgi:hypothetical protein
MKPREHTDRTLLAKTIAELEPITTPLPVGLGLPVAPESL